MIQPLGKPTHTVSFDRNRHVIDIREDGDWIFEVDLEDATNSAELLHWIFQLAMKSWCTPQVLYAVMEAIDGACWDVHGSSAQAAYCPGGEDRKVEWR